MEKENGDGEEEQGEEEGGIGSRMTLGRVGRRGEGSRRKSRQFQTFVNHCGIISRWPPASADVEESVIVIVPHHTWPYNSQGVSGRFLPPAFLVTDQHGGGLLVAADDIGANNRVDEKE